VKNNDAGTYKACYVRGSRIVGVTFTAAI